MKKIRIVTTFTLLDNYGQVLQAYALQRFLRDNYPQFDIKVFNINHAVSFEQMPIITPQKKTLCGKIYAKFKAVERVVRTYFYAYIMRREKYIQRLKEQTLSRQKCEFQCEIDRKVKLVEKFNAARDFVNFKKEHIALHCDEMQDFVGYTDELNADCYIVGSDQVWSGFGTVVLENFYRGKHWIDYFTLKFLPQNHKANRISYSASLGKKEYENDFAKWYFKDALAKFNAISLRESCNIKTLAELGLKSVCVPDPTQLLSKSDYEKLINSANIDEQLSSAKVRKDSVFVYMLSNETQVNKNEMMDFLRGEFGAKCVIYTNGNMWNFGCDSDFKCNFAPTPQEWLACVRDCRLMITNSFHGCAFAITMNTPFVALAQSGTTTQENIRFDNIFEIFGLQNRLVSNLSELKAVMNEPINWDEVNLKLNEWRSVGVEFLAQNLKNL